MGEGKSASTRSTPWQANTPRAESTLLLDEGFVRRIRYVRHNTAADDFGMEEEKPARRTELSNRPGALMVVWSMCSVRIFNRFRRLAVADPRRRKIWQNSGQWRSRMVRRLCGIKRFAVGLRVFRKASTALPVMRKCYQAQYRSHRAVNPRFSVIMGLARAGGLFACDDRFYLHCQ